MDQAQGGSWLSEGLESLLETLDPRRDEAVPDFDIIIVGSGYGGAVAASRLAGRNNQHGEKLRVAVLERGREYLPGHFPSSLSTLAGHARGSAAFSDKVIGTRDGLFDIRSHGPISAVVASGLGGGSLINAGVMEEPHSTVFDERWPQVLHGGAALAGYYSDMRCALGARSHAVGAGGSNARKPPVPNTISRHPDVAGQPLAKTESLRKLGQARNVREAQITVAMDDGPNNSGVDMNRCRLCGDCATGCNFGAKESLDLNLLVQARRHDVKIVTGALVLSLAREHDLWVVNLDYTDPVLAARHDGTRLLRASKVVLAAGTFGSTEILLRSRSQDLAFSGRLGKRFSGNGDMIAVGYDHKDSVNAVADESDDYADRRVGPTITGVIDLREEDEDLPPVVVEEMAVPGPMRRIFEELYTTTDCLQGLAEADDSQHLGGNPASDPLAVDPDAIARTAVYAVIGDDDGNGELSLRDDFEKNSDGALEVQWPDLPNHPLFTQQMQWLDTLKQESGSGGRMIGNPLWNPLPASMDFLLGKQRGPLTTVHPLGGCIMADSAEQGVVNDCGQVFKHGAGNEVYEDLVVLDGAIIPSALGTNPALTIAAVAARAMDQLLQTSAWDCPAGSESASPDWTQRPVWRQMPPPQPVQDTRMQFAERLHGPVRLDLGQGAQAYHLELTLFFQDKSLPDLIAREDDSKGSRHTMTVAGQAKDWRNSSRLRLFTEQQWQDIEERLLAGGEREEVLERECILNAPLSGQLTIMGRAPSSACGRRLRSIWAWLRNRGARDLWQTARAHCRGERNTGGGGLAQVGFGLRYATRAGEMRLFDYQLQIGSGVARDGVDAARFEGKSVTGIKEITYRRRANPLLQMSEIELVEFPQQVRGLRERLGLLPWHRRQRLRLAPEFLARKGLPLFRIVSQHDSVQAMADIGSLTMYYVRLLASIHMMSFRKPDTPTPRQPQRLPQALPGLPGPYSRTVPVCSRNKDGQTHGGAIRLTRYQGRDSDSRPVLCIHGYSASGTTFAHPALQRDLARELWQAGRDVWILDMRSSCGMTETATVNYSFEELARSDIPVAVAEVCKATGHQGIDMVAHCMGAAMLSMAVLEAHRVSPGAPYEQERRALPGRIRRAALSQVGPLVSLAPGNVFRAYLFAYLKHLLPLDDYRFRSSGTRLDELLDRLLAVLPYEVEDFDRANPCRPWARAEWLSTRQRMDLLYGETFRLANLDARTLAHIDDFFGPLSVDTATQVAHFAKYQTITNHAGDNTFVSRAALRSNWRFPTLSIHGERNGLSDVRTVKRMETMLKDAGCELRTEVFADMGHQDCLIGANNGPVLAKIRSFLDQPVVARVPATGGPLTIQVPWSGPAMGPVESTGRGQFLPLSFGINPALSAPKLLLVIPLAKGGGGWQPVLANAAVSARVYAAPAAIDGWSKLMLPLPAGHAQAYLLLLVYDEPPALDNALFGKGDMHLDFPQFQSLSLDVADDAGRVALHGAGGDESLQRALSELVEDPQSHLGAGVVQVPAWEPTEEFHLGLGSCQYPPGILDEVPGFDSYKRLARGLAHSQSPRHLDLLLLMGDQVYTDPTAGFADPTASDERFVLPYQRWYRSRAVRNVLRRVPACMMLDDHEIKDNWEPLPHYDAEHIRVRDRGVAHYRNFQRGPQLPGTGPLWYAMKVRGFDIFMADTRTARFHRSAHSQPHLASLLGRRQEAALEAWLQSVAGDTRPKFLVSPAMVAPRLRAVTPSNVSMQQNMSMLRSDGWEGYPAALELLLALVAQYEVENLVCLSGDTHLSCAASLTLKDGGQQRARLWSVHASALYAPYPFANGAQGDFRAHETFALAGGLQCNVSTDFAPVGDGFSYLSVTRPQGKWRVELSVDREAGVSAPVVLR